jgi:hypothetical protein
MEQPASSFIMGLMQAGQAQSGRRATVLIPIAATDYSPQLAQATRGTEKVQEPGAIWRIARLAFRAMRSGPSTRAVVRQSFRGTIVVGG